MAPRRPSAKKAKQARRSTAARKAKDSATPRQLIAEARGCLTQGDALSALTRARQALEALEGSNNDDDEDEPSTSSPRRQQQQQQQRQHRTRLGAACTLLGEIHLELGDAAEAQRHFRDAVEADPDGTKQDDDGGGAGKFLYLAQLSEAGGRDSVDWFERGAAALRAGIAAREDEAGRARLEAQAATLREEAGQMRRRLAEVLCAVAEVWMTDLSFEPDCEAQCERLVTEATMLAPGSAEVWQTLASVRVSQNRGEDAQAALGRSLATWEDLPPEDAAVPEFAVRVGLVRLLMTVGLLEKAVEVAERLVQDDDESVEVWYLGGYGLYLIGEALKEGGELESWREYWTTARRWLGTCLKLFQQQEYEDEALRDHAGELLANVTGEVGEAPPDGEDEWEDTAGEEEESGDDESADEEMK